MLDFSSRSDNVDWSPLDNCKWLHYFAVSQLTFPKFECHNFSRKYYVLQWLIILYVLYYSYMCYTGVI